MIQNSELVFKRIQLIINTNKHLQARLPYIFPGTTIEIEAPSHQPRGLAIVLVSICPLRAEGKAGYPRAFFAVDKN